MIMMVQHAAKTDLLREQLAKLVAMIDEDKLATDCAFSCGALDSRSGLMVVVHRDYLGEGKAYENG